MQAISFSMLAIVFALYDRSVGSGQPFREPRQVEMAANSVGARGGAGFRRLAWLFAVGLVLAQAALLTWNLERGYHRTLDTEYARLGDATRIANENMSGTLRAIDLLLRDVASEHDRLGTTESASLTD